MWAEEAPGLKVLKVLSFTSGDVMEKAGKETGKREERMAQDYGFLKDYEHGSGRG